MVCTDPTCPKTDYSVNGLNSDMGSFFSLVSARVIPANAMSPIPDHINSINYNLISLKIIFDAVKDKFLSCSVNKLPGVFLLRGLYLLSRVVSFHSPVPLKLASNNPTFLQTSNVIWPRSQ